MPESNTTTTKPEKKAPVIAGFELLKRVGRGGMGTVYRARQLSVDRIVAVKILKPALTSSTSFIKRFKDEAKAAAQLNHPNIVQAIDAGEDQGYYYFAMEFVDGETLHRLMLREGVLEEKRALKIARDVTMALAHAFQHGIVHRDIKPGNIMISQQFETKLCDLGLARVMADEDPQLGKGAALGTPYYISPEQALGMTDVDSRADIYSLGATLFRAVVGRPVYSAATPAEILELHVKAPLPWPKDFNPELSEEVCYVLAKMMAKKPEERYQTPDELSADLQRLLAGEKPKSSIIELAIPPARLSEEDRKEKAITTARLRKKQEAVKQLAEVRTGIDKICREKSIPPQGVVRMLRGNLDEEQPETFLKYGIILLAEKKFTLARQHFHSAQELGADVSTFMAKLDALGAPPGMTYIPEGSFTDGPPDNEKQIETKAFYLDVNLVTNRKYYDFMRATDIEGPPHWIDNNIPEGMENYPVVNITWEEARDYAEWAGKRLPTVAEWEKAARGPLGQRYPWGNEFDSLRCNVHESGHGDLTEAGRYPKGRSPYGCFDMFGNVVQWCAGTVRTANGGEARPVCGVSFAEEGADKGSWLVRLRQGNKRSRKCGFRCAMSI